MLPACSTEEGWGWAITYHPVDLLLILHPATPEEALDSIGRAYGFLTGCPDLTFLCGGVCEMGGAGNGEDGDFGDSSRHDGLLQLYVPVFPEGMKDDQFE